MNKGTPEQTILDCYFCLGFWRLRLWWIKRLGARRIEFENGLIGWARGNVCIIEMPMSIRSEE